MSDTLSRVDHVYTLIDEVSCRAFFIYESNNFVDTLGKINIVVALIVLSADFIFLVRCCFSLFPFLFLFFEVAFGRSSGFRKAVVLRLFKINRNKATNNLNNTCFSYMKLSTGLLCCGKFKTKYEFIHIIENFNLYR